MTVAAENALTRQCRSSVPNTANMNPVITNSRSPSTPSGPIWPIDSAPITTRPPTMATAPSDARGRYPLAQEHRGEQQAAERRAGRLDHAAMAERHEQKTGVADQRHHRPAQHHQQQAAAPADAAEIADAGAQHDRQEHDARPQEAVHQQIRRRETELQPVPCRHEAERPEQRRARAARDPEQGRLRIGFSGWNISAAGRLVHRGGLTWPAQPYNPRPCRARRADKRLVRRSSGSDGGGAIRRPSRRAAMG